LLDVTAFYIDWRDIILYIYGAGANLNGAAVRSQGAELLASYDPLPGLKLGYVAAYTQAEWTQLPADSSYLKGFQLPQVPKWNMSFSADYDWLLWSHWHAQLGANLRYVDRAWSLFVQGPPVTDPCTFGARPTIEKPAYSVLDLHAGIARDALTIKVFARNVFDERAILHSNLLGPCYVPGGVAGDGPAGDQAAAVPLQSEAFIVQPRTIGVGFEYLFH
jgi:iron complex outermembrane recepter protein